MSKLLSQNMEPSSYLLSRSCVILAVLAMTAIGCEEGAPGLPFFKNEYSILHHIDENTYKAIDCSAEQACHVEWYKDGVLFPFGWSAMQQQAMGVSMGADNQTLILKKAEMTTKGNYTCIVSNQHGTIERHLELKVQGNDWIHEPILAFDNNCNHKKTRIGSNVTFTCKFFVGPKEDESVASWFYEEKETPDKTIHKNSVVWIWERELNYTVYETSSLFLDGKLSVFSLTILNVTEPALGTYFVQAYNGIGPSKRHSLTLSLHQPEERRGRYMRILRDRLRTSAHQ
ncbi:fibroblast growth factor receptor-like isoform X2 [Apostichopus japonicus]|uniref:fibroblast growth factor receptor-like isoform X2 n=1 Tax=Stichopus japonicus TaxID=307972 RepID=UPI003AB792E4